MYVYIHIHIYTQNKIYLKGRVSLCNSDCDGTVYINQAGIELTEIYLPLPLSARIKGMLLYPASKSF